MTSHGRGQSTKTLKEKVEILREVDGGKTSKLEIARKHGIPKSTLSTYIKNKRAIEEAYATDAFTGSRKRLCSAKHPELERAVLTWIKEMRSQNIPLSGPIVMAKAADYALRLNIDDFKASEGWLHRFRERHEIVFCTMSGEGKEVNSETCAKWRSGALQEHLHAYSPRDIFNADETALFYKLLPSKTLTYKGDNCAGGKRSKERVSLGRSKHDWDRKTTAADHREGPEATLLQEHSHTTGRVYSQLQGMDDAGNIQTVADKARPQV